MFNICFIFMLDVFDLGIHISHMDHLEGREEEWIN